MTRIAVPLLIAFIALLGFIYAMASQRRNRNRALVAHLRHQIGGFETQLTMIQQVARGAADVDPSAALIDQMITDFRRKELE